MSILILIKHSMPLIDPVVPAEEWSLSEQGRQLCHQLSLELQVYPFQLLFSSPEPKALETAQILASNLQLEVVVRSGLHEHKRRTAPFGTHEAFQHSVSEFFSHPDRLVFGEETANEAANRFNSAIHELISQNKGNSLAIVAHGTVITLFTALANQIDPFRFWKDLGLPSFVILSLPDLKLLSPINSIDLTQDLKN